MALILFLPARMLLAISIIIGMVMAAALSWIYLPKAVVELTPEQAERTVTQDIVLSNAIREPDYIRYKLPMKVVEAQAADEKQIQRSGTELKDDLAKGVVTIINNRDEEQNLLPKTHLRHQATGVFFLTDKAVKVPPRGKVEVSVTAKQMGASGNVSPGRLVIDKLAASLQPTVYAESQRNFSGGVIVEQPLTPAELENAKTEMMNQLRERAKAELTVKAGGAFIRPELVDFKDEKISSSAEAGSKAQNYSIKAETKAVSAVVDDNDLLSLTLLKLRGAVEPEEEFISYDPQSFAMKIKRSDFERGEIIVEGKLTGKFAKKIPVTAFNGKLLAGLSTDEVTNNLTQLPGVGAVKVELKPFWVMTVPGRQEAVEIKVKN